MIPKSLSAATIVAAAILAVTPAAMAAIVGEGLKAARQGEYDRAVDEFQPLAEAGDPRAQFFLGLCYQQGKGVPMNPSRAASWFDKAATAGNAGAQSALGTQYLTGQGVTPDADRAYALLTQAAGAGDRRAKYGLGIISEEGLGRGVDIAKALG